MAFGNINTFHLPLAANAGSNQWGAGDVRKLLDAAEASADTTSITNHGTGGSVTRTVDPYTTKATDDTEANFGWAVTPDDMNAIAGRYVLDVSGNNRHGQVFGSPSLIAGVTNFGTRPLFTGAANNGLVAEGVAQPGTWTVEARIRRDRSSVAEYVFNWNRTISGNYYGVNCFFIGSGGNANKLGLQVFENGVLTGGVVSLATVATGEHQVAVEKIGSVFYLLLDGVLQASFTPSSHTAITGSFCGACASVDAVISAPLQGAIDEVRVSNVSRYGGANYTPATTPFTSDANTMLLWHCDELSAKRVIAAGNHTINGRMRDNSSVGVTATLLMYVYRVAAGSGRARTLLGSNSASVSLPALAAIADAVVSANLAEIILEPDETIEYGFEVTAAGIAVSGRTITFLTGLSTTSVRIDQPGLKTVADGAVACTAAAVVTGAGSKVLGGVASVTASAAMAAVGGAIGAGVLASVAAAAVDAKGSAVAAGALSVAAQVDVDAKGSKVLGGVMESSSGGDTIIVVQRRIIDG